MLSRENDIKHLAQLTTDEDENVPPLDEPPTKKRKISAMEPTQEPKKTPSKKGEPPKWRPADFVKYFFNAKKIVFLTQTDFVETAQEWQVSENFSWHKGF